MSASRERPKLGFEVRMCGGGKIDHWVLRVTRDFESVFIYLFIYFFGEGDKQMRNEKV